MRLWSLIIIGVTVAVNIHSMFVEEKVTKRVCSALLGVGGYGIAFYYIWSK